jgi:hypothetical protein
MVEEGHDCSSIVSERRTDGIGACSSSSAHVTSFMIPEQPWAFQSSFV